MYSQKKQLTEEEQLLHKLKVSLQENQYIVPSYSLYGGQAGYQDYGILGVRFKNNLIAVWRDHFLREDDIFEIETPTIMPYDVLKASGHVDRFSDWVFYDDESGCHRVDQLLKKYFKEHQPDLVDQVDGWNKDMMEKQLNKLIQGPVDSKTKKPQKVEIFQKNLMFEVGSIGPATSLQHPESYLRPELAQGIAVNFLNFTNFLQKEPPFGIAQVGKSYRREINPVPFTRLREFNQAEIEYLVDPQNKHHPAYNDARDVEIPLLSAQMQIEHKNKPMMMKIDQAVHDGVIAHTAIAYFLGRIYQFCLKIGLHADKIRFRQHMPHEMAHYANQCWDLEALVSDSWLECIGCADRGSYDLTAHGKQNPLVFRRLLKEPIVEKKLKAVVDQKIVGPRYGSTCQMIIHYFNNLDQTQLSQLKSKLDRKEDLGPVCIDDNLFSIDRSMVKVVEEEKKIVSEMYVPHIVEPSFGLDRIIYAVLEQNFWMRPKDPTKPKDIRCVLSLPQKLVPYDIAVFQLSNHPDLMSVANNVSTMLKNEGYSVHREDSNITIGLRYVRADEMGIKYAVTVDFDSLTDGKVTLRERDSMYQLKKDKETGKDERVPISELAHKIAELK